MAGNRGYKRKSTNNLDEGVEFERLIRVSTLLTMQDNQSLACEMDEAGKFDDLVVWVKSDGCYLRQLKHKQDKTFKIEEKHLFPSKSQGMYAVGEYLSSFSKIYNNSAFVHQGRLIKELTLTTNVDFDSSVKNEYLDTVAPSPIWISLHSQQSQSDRYKFKSGKHADIKNKLKTPASIPNTIVDSFLDLLVFEVKHPDITEQQAMIQCEVRSLIPYELNDQQAEEASKSFQAKYKNFFDNLPTTNVPWVTMETKHDILLDILIQLKGAVKLGSTINYEKQTLLPILETIQSINFSQEVREKLENNFQTNNFGFLNIIVPPTKSFPILTSCKILSYFQRSERFDQEKVWMIDIKSKDNGERVAKFFGHPNFKLLSNFIFVVEFSQELCTKSMTSEIVHLFAESLRNSLPLNLILITSEKIQSIENMVPFQEILDDVLTWENFSEETRNILFIKTLPIEQQRTFISLEQLGINLKLLDSLSLSELVLADKDFHLDFHLPAFNKEIKEIYVDRKLRLPVISENELGPTARSTLFFDSENFEAAKHRNPNHTYQLLRSLEELGIPCDNAKNLFLLIRTNEGIVDELRHSVEKSLKYTVTIDQKLLLEDVALFDKSHNIKAAVVVDLPGMGKSTLLSHLCNVVLEDLNNSSQKLQKIVLRVNLGDCQTSTWDSTSLESQNDAIQFFITYSRGYMERRESKKTMTSLSKNIIEALSHGRSSWGVILMLDGFDEISNKGRNFVEKLIELLLPMEGVRRIIVASRPDGGIHEKLEIRFNQFAMHLLELDFSNQQKLLVACWKKQLRLNNEHSLFNDNETRFSQRCEEFANFLISKARQQLTDEDKNILDVPLQCILFAECFYDKLKQYLEPSHNLLRPLEQEAIENFDILSLFNKFFDNKVLISHSVKAKNQIANDFALEDYEDRKKNFQETLQRISIYNMIKSKDKFRLLFGERWNVKKFREDMERAKRLGLVAYSYEDEPESEGSGVTEPAPTMSFGLIHRTFAEYFVAQCLIETFMQPSDNRLSKKTFNLIMDIILHKKEYMGIRRFFLRMSKDKFPDNMNDGCPFSQQNRLDVARKWPLVSHEKFNDFLADDISSGSGNIFELVQSKKGKDALLNITNFPLMKWLMMCIKEHIVRKLTATSTIIEKFSEDMFKFISQAEMSREGTEADIFDNKEAHRFFLVLLHWYDQPMNVPNIEHLKICFFSVIEKLLTKDSSMVSRYKLPFMAAVSTIAKRQSDFGSEDNDFRWVFEHFFKESEKQCVTRHLILSGEPSEENVTERNNAIKYLNYHLTLNRVNNGECSLRLNAEHLYLCFKELLELGSPSSRKGDTSLLENQICWFLSVRPLDSSENESLGWPYDGYRHRREIMNPFLVICVNYLLLMIDRHIIDEGRANDFRRRVVRHALRLDARILKWLEHVRLYKKREDLVDHEENAIRKAIELLPVAHQAAHEGNLTKLKNLEQDHTQWSQLFEWTPSDQLAKHKIVVIDVVQNLDSFFENASVNDSIPPALYLAAANHKSEICSQVLTEFIRDVRNKDRFKLLVSRCLIYTLYCVNDESLVLQLFPSIRDELSKKILLEIFPHNEEAKFNLFRKGLWTIDTKKEEWAILYTLALHRKSELLKEFHETYMGGSHEAVNEILKIVVFILKERNMLLIWSMPCVNSLLTYALEKYENCMDPEIFYNSTCQSMCREIFKTLQADFKTPILEVNTSLLIEELKASLKKILSSIWERKGEEDFVKFVVGSEEYAFGKSGNYRNTSESGLSRDAMLLNEAVQEYIPRKLTATALTTLIKIITESAWEHDRTWLDGILSSYITRRVDVFKSIKERALHLGGNFIKDIAFSITVDNGRPFVINLLNTNKQLGENLLGAMDKRLVTRVEVLQAFYDAGNFSKSKITFDLENYLRNCVAHFNNREDSINWGIISWDKLENLINNDFHNWMDIGIDVLKFLNCQVQDLLSTHPEQENVLSDLPGPAFRKHNWIYWKHKNILLTSLTFAREFSNTMLHLANNDQDVTKLINVTLDCINNFSIPVVLAPQYFTFLVSLSSLFKAVKIDTSFQSNYFNTILLKVKQREYNEVLNYYLRCEDLSEEAFKVRFLDTFDVQIKPRIDQLFYDVIWSLTNLAIINDWFV